jgi:toxin-antitoxin system PIN domain toxin
VILVDVNLLMYAAHSGAPDAAMARAWLDDRLNDVDRVGLPWAVILAFVRLSSNRSVTSRPVTPSEAWQRVETEWLARRNVWIPKPGPSHGRILGALLSEPGMTSRHVTDAHLAALAIEHGLTLCSADGGFANFPGLSWMNPLRPNTLHERSPLWLALREERPRTDTPSSRKRRR